jgi:hypothetical protein
MATENESEQRKEATNEAPAEQPQEAPKESAAELRRAAEDAIDEAAKAVLQAVRARARLYAPAPLDHAENRLTVARDHYEAGAYSEARMVAQQALASADQSLGHALNTRQIRAEQQRRRRLKWFYAILTLLIVGLVARLAVPVVRAWRSRPAKQAHAGPSVQPAPETANPASVRSLRPTAPGNAAEPQTQPPSPQAATSRPGPENPPPERFVTVIDEPLNVREGPGLHYPSQERQLNRGERVRVVGEQEGWLKVDLGQGKRGWIARRFTREASEP